MVMVTRVPPTSEPNEGGMVVLDGDGAVVAFTDACPALLGIVARGEAAPDAVSAAVAEALADLRLMLSSGERRDAEAETDRGAFLWARPLSNGGWSVEVRPARPLPRQRADVLAEILDSIDASLVAYDADEIYIFGNRRFHELYPNHPPEEELVGSRFSDMIRQTIDARVYVESQAYEDPEAYIARRLAEFRAPLDRPTERRLPTGEWHLLRRMETPRGMRVTLRVDITEQKRLQQELTETSERLRLVSEAKSRFLAGMSHELRTPLNAIIGFADMMRQQVFGPLGAPHYLGYADDILRSGEHLLALISDLLDFSKVEAGALELYREPIDLGRFLADELRMFGPEAQRRGLAVTLDCPEPAPALDADSRALRQMLMNLVSNALKFTAEGGIRVAAGVRPDGGVDISVTDTGVGIAEASLERLGEPFYQAHDPRQRATGGTGLGLAMVRELMNLHGGALDVESRVGEGTVVTLRFPAGDQDAAAAVTAPAPPAADASDASPPPVRRHTPPDRRAPRRRAGR